MAQVIYAYKICDGTSEITHSTLDYSFYDEKDGFWWWSVGNGTVIREDLPFCSQDYVAMKYKEKLAKKYTSVYDYNEIEEILKNFL